MKQLELSCRYEANKTEDASENIIYYSSISDGCYETYNLVHLLIILLNIDF